MLYCRISLLFLFIKFQVKCEEKTEEKTSVKFLLSDAKKPNFNLEEFRQKKVIEDDNVAAESIILPTLNLESHPYAVIVLPDLNKYKSKAYKRGRLTLDDIINGKMGKVDDEEEEEQQLELPSNYEPSAAGNNNLLLPEIPVIPIVKSAGKIIDLNEELNPVTFIPDEESEGEIIDYVQDESQTADEDHLYSYEVINEDLQPIEDVEDEASLLSDNEGTDLVPAKNVVIARELKTNLESYLTSERKTKSIDEDTIGEIISAESQHSGKTISSNEKYKISPASLEKKSRVTFKGFPLKFNNVLKFSEDHGRQPSGRVGEEIITKVIEQIKQNISLPKQTLRIQTVQNLPIVSEFSELKDSSILSDKSEQQVLNSVTKNQFSTLGKARELRPVPVYENNLQDETVVRKRESTSSSDDIIDVKNQKQQTAYSNYTADEHTILNKSNVSEQKYTETFLTDQVQEAGLNFVPQSVSNNTFEFIRAIGTPIFPTKKQSDKNSSHLVAGSSSIEQRKEQINQLLKLRKQLMLLDTSSFAAARSNAEVNPENKIGSYQVESSKEIEPNVPQKNINTDVNTNLKPEDIHASNNDPKDNPIPLPIKGKGGSSLTWSKFLKKSEVNNDKLRSSTPIPLVTEKNDKNLESTYKTTPPSQRTDIKFNPLESIRAPIIEPLHLHTRLKPNQSEEISVVFEKFDLSNAISFTNTSKYSSTGGNIDTNEQVSYNLPELSLGKPSGEDQQTNYQENLELDSSAFKRETNSEIPRSYHTSSSDLQANYPNYPENESCIHGEEKCDEENDLQIYKVAPVVVHFASRDFNYETLVPTVLSTVRPYKQSRTITQTVQLTTIAPTKPPFQTADVIQNESNDKPLEPPMKVEPRVIAPPLDNFTVTNPVHRASIKPTDLTTPLVIHNVLSLDTITRYATVTVMTPSPVIHTHTEVVEQTRYVTITTTIPAEPLYTSTILHVMPDPKTVTVSVAALTETSTLATPSTVTHTLFSTVCKSDELFSDDVHYGSEGLLESPTDFHMRTAEYQKSFSTNSEFDEHFWPKASHKSPWPAGFNTDKFEPSSEITGSHDNHLPDLEAEESGLIMSVADPNDKTHLSKNRQRMSRSEKFNNSPVMYGVPFYGFRPIDEEYPLYKSPGKGNSMKIKI